MANRTKLPNGIHFNSSSVSFDSLAPARLTPSGPTFGCSSSKVPTFPVVVNSAGFGLKRVNKLGPKIQIEKHQKLRNRRDLQ